MISSWMANAESQKTPFKAKPGFTVVWIISYLTNSVLKRRCTVITRFWFSTIYFFAAQKEEMVENTV